MTSMSSNRYLSAIRIIFDNPVNSMRFAFDTVRGCSKHHKLKFGEIALSVRTLSPDLKVVRACLLGEFDKALEQTSSDARFIVDGGGYIGLASILFAQKFPQAKVLCLEPSSENFRLAERNCRPYSNITVINAALGKTNGSSVLRDRGTGQWGFTLTDTDSKQIGIETVTVVSLDDLMLQHRVECIDLLKLDIEGSEYDLFEVADTWLERCSVLVVELHERIRPGVEALHEKVTVNRHHAKRDSEKCLSVIAKENM